jgi:GT2 family glycosyltransferase
MSVPHRWEVIQAKLNEPLRPMSAPRNAAGAYLVFWWNDVPLGHTLIHAWEFPLNEADLQRRALRAIAPAVWNYSLKNGFKPALPELRKHPVHNLPTTLESLAALSRPLENLAIKVPQASRQLSVSVIVCTRRHSEQLRRCLAALQQVAPPPSEIIVVDNAPAERRTLDVVEEFDGMIYCPELALGVGRARNCGILHSSGEIVAFTDDDFLVYPHWLVGVREAFSQDTVFGMTGLVLAEELETESQVRFELDFGGFNRGYCPTIFDSLFFNSMLTRGVPVWRIGVGANMAFRREVFSRIGLFDESLGPSDYGRSEDSEFWYRMLVVGMPIAYEPRAVVLHSHRVDRGAFTSQMKQYMRGHVAALLVQFEKHRHFGNMRMLFLTLPHYFYRRLKRVLLKGDWGLLFGELLGCASGFVTYFRQITARRFHSSARKGI